MREKLRKVNKFIENGETLVAQIENEIKNAKKLFVFQNL